MKKYSLEFIVMLLKEQKLVNPYHMEMVSDGYGEFPDSYKLTDIGAERLLKSLQEKLR